MGRKKLYTDKQRRLKDNEVQKRYNKFRTSFYLKNGAHLVEELSKIIKENENYTLSFLVDAFIVDLYEKYKSK